MYVLCETLDALDSKINYLASSSHSSPGQSGSNFCQHKAASNYLYRQVNWQPLNTRFQQLTLIWGLLSSQPASIKHFILYCWGSHFSIAVVQTSACCIFFLVLCSSSHLKGWCTWKQILLENVQNTHVSPRNSFLWDFVAYFKHKMNISHEECSPWPMGLFLLNCLECICHHSYIKAPQW